MTYRVRAGRLYDRHRQDRRTKVMTIIYVKKKERRLGIGKKVKYIG